MYHMNGIAETGKDQLFNLYDYNYYYLLQGKMLLRKSKVGIIRVILKNHWQWYMDNIFQLGIL